MGGFIQFISRFLCGRLQSSAQGGYDYSGYYQQQGAQGQQGGQQQQVTVSSSLSLCFLSFCCAKHCNILLGKGWVVVIGSALLVIYAFAFYYL